MSESPEGSPTPTPVVQAETKTTGLKITRVGELLPKNPRTEKLLEARRNEEMKKKKEEDERRLKFEKRGARKEEEREESEENERTTSQVRAR